MLESRRNHMATVHRRVLPLLMTVTLTALSMPWAVAAVSATTWAIADLRCEYRTAPLGMDETEPRLSWKLSSKRRGETQSAYRIFVATSPARLAAGAADVWDSGRVPSSRSTSIPYEGSALESGRLYHWRVQAWSRDGDEVAEARSHWEMGLLEPADWRARWVGLPGTEAETDSSQASPYLRGTFSIDRTVRRARIYATALGVYELHVNGTRVSGDYFTPGWTDYHRRLQYQTYDVTPFLAQGVNAVGAILGDGWYAGAVGIDARRHHYGPYPLGLLAQLHVDYEDGSRLVFITDGSWSAATGPILASDLLMGETYDSRRELVGWSAPEFDATAWQAVSVLPAPDAELVAQSAPTVQQTAQLAPVSVAEPAPGAFVFDLGQNMVGWARLRVRAQAGTEVRLRFAEALQSDGNLYVENLRAARATDTYITRGGIEEVFEPHFTYHGFRYVEVTGLPAKPALDAVTGIVVGSATEPAGHFESSSALLNQLHSNILWSQRGNFIDVPTDCPQRDERLGWMGDVQLFVGTACYNMQAATFFSKWLQDMRDAQSSDGAFPDVTPRLVITSDGAPGWGDAGIIVPWELYRHYGDRRLLERHYDAMRRWLTYIRDANATSIRNSRLNANYGDWLALGTETPKDLLATAYYAEAARTLAQTADVLGREADAAHFRAVFEEIRQAFNLAYVRADGTIESDTQTAYALALQFRLLDAEDRSAAARRLAAVVAADGHHVRTGFLGTRHLLPALSESGFVDVAYRVLMNDGYPSWGHQIRSGATTTWERWDGWTEERGFQDPLMNSFNHYALGSVGEWLYSTVAGLRMGDRLEGCGNYLIQPRPGGGLSWVAARYESTHGPLRVAWRREGGDLELDVGIPANARAEVHVPSVEGTGVSESGLEADSAEEVRFLRFEGGAAVFDVGSGDYTFHSRLN